MSSLIAVILPYILLYKYWAIFMITLVAALAFPIPPGTLLMASAAFASQGYFSFTWVVVAGVLGNIVGDNIGYWLARFYGKRVLRKIGFKKILESDKYKKVEQKLKRRPAAFIFFSRFEVFTNLAVNLICGLGELNYRKYLFLEVLGEICQVTLYATIGYFVGDNWGAVSAIISRSLIFIIVFAGLLAAIFWKRIRKSFE